MTKFVDFEELKKRVSIEDAVKLLDLELKAGNGQLRGKCPVCEGTSDRNLVVTPSKGVYYCFADGKGGDVIALVAHIRKCSAKDAAQFLAGDTVPEKGRQQQSSSEGGFKPLDYLEHDHPAVEAVGLKPDDAKRIGAGFAPRGVLKNTVAIPIRLEDGRLIGYIGITEATLPKEWRF